MPENVRIPTDGVGLEGILEIPTGAKGLVVFAHGTGSNRYSPRNTFVASILHKENLATLLIDLLTETEEQIYEKRFEIDLLTNRLVAITQWLREQKAIGSLTLGYFGASTGAAAALQATSSLGSVVAAVVSRGGRPDLALAVLGSVQTPTLLIVGGADTQVLKLNRAAFEKLPCTKKLEIVPGATHLFEEPGALEAVSQLASQWFTKYLAKNP